MSGSSKVEPPCDHLRAGDVWRPDDPTVAGYETSDGWSPATPAERTPGASGFGRLRTTLAEKIKRLRESDPNVYPLS